MVDRTRDGSGPALLEALSISVLALLVCACSGPKEKDDSARSAAAEERPVIRDWKVPLSAPGGQPYGDEFRHRLAVALNSKPEGYRPRTHHRNVEGSPVYTNRLILESSPYLLQHAHNPVDWYPWSDETFELARKLGRPVILSVGYSTCHWCHVMERESFEDVEIATYMNENFIAIKVDREERPDIDNVYMNAVRAMSGRGGWPMTVVLTPDREPFFGGTYFPARDGDRGSGIGFLTILQKLAEQYAESREETVTQAAKITRKLQAQAQPPVPGGLATADVLSAAVQALSQSYDPQYGGFGRAPKFPRSVTLEFLMRYYRRTEDDRALEMVALTLERMAAGGMYDQVGGGFHRYSTDQRWLVPHFEKMLYDNAQLAVAYLEAYQITDNEAFAETARETLDYVAREMTSPEGGFYSATDADSRTPSGHQEEGWYFTWTRDDIAQIVGADVAGLVNDHYGVTIPGNFERRNILNIVKPLSRIAADSGRPAAEVNAELDAAKAQLYEARSLRPPPGKDTKVLTSWNGLMIAAFARGARVLDEPRYAEIGSRAAGFLLEEMRVGDGRLARSWNDGSVRHDAVLDDYAFLAHGLIELYQTTQRRRWLAASVELTDQMISRFGDPDAGAFFFTASDAEELLIRQKPDYDGAEPAGNSVAIGNLLQLYELTGDYRYRENAEQALQALARTVQERPTAVPKLLSAIDFMLDRPKQIVIVKPDPGADARVFIEAVASTFLPNSVLIVTSQGRAADELSELVPLVKGKKAQGGAVTAYVCEQQVCELPTTEVAEFSRQLAKTEAYPVRGGSAAAF
jgi:uncharacterized protein YyaL (SSP411 family)